MEREDLCGRKLGGLTLRERIGEGGFGAVYRCEQPLLDRDLVVKVMHKKLRHDGDAMKRFMQEAKLASSLDHPYAAHVYDFAIDPRDGLFWMVMEYVDGVTLGSWLQGNGPMPFDVLVEFVERVARVVHAAHQRGIVHRDIKPSNVMVIERAGELLPKLLDFGIAKRLLDEAALPADELVAEDPAPPDADRDPDNTANLRRGRKPAVKRTIRGMALGSAQYMAPEQWDDAATVGPAADLYALGVVVFQMLTGRLPFTAANTGEYDELHRHAPVPPLGDGFSPAFDRIFQRALAKRPEDRYSSALELAAALRAELRAQLPEQVRVAARQWSDRDRPDGLLWRGNVLTEIGRSPSSVTPLGELELAFIEASWHYEMVLAEQARRREHEREAAQLEAARERESARATREFARATAVDAGRHRAKLIRAFGVALSVVLIAAGVGAFAFQSAYQTRMALQRQRAAEQVAEVVTTTAEVEQGRAALLHGESSAAQLHLATAYQRGDHSMSTEFMLSRAVQPRLAELARFKSTSGRMWSAAFSPDGKQIVSTDDQGAQLWDSETHRLLFALPHGHAVYHAAYSADGTQLVTAGVGVVKLWDASSGALVRDLRPARRDGKVARYSLVATSPDGTVVAAIDTEGEVVHVWDVATGALRAELPNDGSGFPSLSFSADGRWLATSGGDDVRVFDVSARKVVRKLAARHVHSVSFDPTGPRVVTGATDGDASIWDVRSGARLRHLREVGDPIDAVAFSPSGAFVVTASRDGTEQVWNAASGQRQGQANHLRCRVLSVEFDATSALIVAAGESGTVVVSDAVLGVPVSVLDGPRKLVRVAHFDSTARRVVGASWDGTVRVWDASSPYRRWKSPEVSDGCGLVMSLDPDRRVIAVGCGERPTRVWDTARDQLLAELPSVTPVAGDFATAYPAVAAAGDRAAIARGNTVEVYELPGGRKVRSIVHAAAVTAVTFAPTGHELVSGSVDGALLVTRDGRDSIALPSLPAAVDVTAILPDGRVVAADAQRQIRVYDADRGALLGQMAASTRIGLLRSSQDGLRLVTVPSYTGETAAAVLWDATSYRVVRELAGNEGQVFGARFFSDGAIVTTGNDGAVRLWDSTTGELRQTYRASSRFFADATVSPDGAMVVAGAADGVLQFWETSSGSSLWTLKAHRSHVVGVHYEGTDIVTRGFGGDVSRWNLPNPEAVIGTCAAIARCGIVPR